MSGFLVPDTKKAKQTPGNTAWATASPTSARFRSIVKQPTTADVAANSIDPSVTYRTFASVRVKKSVQWSSMF